MDDLNVAESETIQLARTGETMGRDLFAASGRTMTVRNAQGKPEALAGPMTMDNTNNARSPAEPSTKFNFLKRLSEHLSMGPRKRSKPNSKAPASSTPAELDRSSIQPQDPSETSQPASNAVDSNIPVESTADGAADPPSAPRDPARKDQDPDSKSRRKTWYNGGSWRLKASPAAAQVARDSISVEGGTTSEMPAEGSKHEAAKSPTNFLSKRRSSKGDPLAASMTKLNVMTNGSNKSKTDVQEGAPETSKEPAPTPVPDPPLPPDPLVQESKAEHNQKNEAENGDKDESKKPAPTSTWRIFWSRPDGYGSDGQKDYEAKSTATVSTEEAQKTPLPGVTPLEDPTDTSEPRDTDAATGQEQPIGEPEQQGGTKLDDKGTQGRSWFWLWSSVQNTRDDGTTTVDSSQPETTDSQEAPLPAQTEQSASTTPNGTQRKETYAESTKDAPKTTPQKSSGWAFWSRAKATDDKQHDESSVHKEAGELAVADTPSQSKPEAAQYTEQEEAPPKEPPKPSRGRARVKEPSSKPSTPVKTTPSHSPVRKPAEAAVTKQTQKQPHPNLLLPEFNSTYRLAQTPSYWQQIRRYLLGGEAAAPHLHIVPSPPRIKKALAIGVHGYFPAPLLQKVLGQPTGTSIRFANAAATAIKEWTDARGYECEIEKVALEGEGFIADRVTTLWKLLLNWIDHIKEADFIMVACHSQGVPVAIMLVAKLIQFGCVNASRIGVCAMAGVNLGPFPEYKSRFFGGSAAELFDFSKPHSKVSQMYVQALNEVLNYGVRIVYIGSIDDQLVSLESSTFSNISHPYIYRAVFVDGRIHAPDFITHLVGFTLKLRNLGLPDHGLIRELSPALAGSLYTGEGHSRIYDDPAVYTLAVRHALETTSLPHAAHSPSAGTSSAAATKLTVKDYNDGSAAATNPYFLPWAMRGLLEEDFVRKELGDEVEELLAMFESWRPVSKGLKDVRFRLEAVRSKL